LKATPRTAAASITGSCEDIMQPDRRHGLETVVSNDRRNVGVAERVGETRAAPQQFVPSLETQKHRRTSPPPGTSVSTSTGGRRKGGLTQKASTCHGCRRKMPPHGLVEDCVGIDTEVCHYWLCPKCFSHYEEAAEREATGIKEFSCCIHGGLELCVCPRNKRNRRTGPQGTLQRSAQAKNRAVPTTIFQLPTPTSSAPTTATTAPSSTPGSATGGGAPARSVGSSTTFSVCTALNQLRVSVVKANNVFMCSRGECRKVEQLRAAAGRQGDTNSALADRCQHADVVRKAKVSSQSIPTATACLNGDGEFENALASVPPGTFNEKMVRAMQQRYARAKEEGVPVLVRLAETAWFAVRDGVTFQRNVIGGWGHVKTRSDTTDGSGHMFQCKDTDGVEYEPDGDMGVKEGDRDANMGFAWNIQREDEALFGERMAMARKIIAVYKFPIEEPQLKDGTYGRDKIHVNERICTGCRTPYEVLPDTDAILVGQGAALRIVDVERKKCNTCNLRGWAGDNFLEDGVFNYNENIVVELRVLYQLRLAFRAGTPVSTWLRTFLQPRLDNMDWLEQNPMLASR
ncbi:unnamed protein product, partial [Ectocarpus sp. 12 AP-2014]